MSILFEWLSPSGMIAFGVIVGLVQQWLAYRRVTALAEATASAAAASANAAEKIAAVAVAVQEVKVQTDGMSHRLAAMAEAKGRAEGKADGIAEAAEKSNI